MRTTAIPSDVTPADDPADRRIDRDADATPTARRAGSDTAATADVDADPNRSDAAGVVVADPAVDAATPATSRPTPHARTVRGRLAALAVAVLLVAVASVATLVVDLLLLSVGSSVPVPSTTLLAASAAAGGLLTFAVGFTYVVRRLDGVDLRVPNAVERRWVAGGLLAALVVAFAALSVGNVVGGSVAAGLLAPVLVADPALRAALVVLAVLVVAPAEELLFRGAVQGRLGRSFGTVAAVVVAGGLFAAVSAAAVLTVVGGASAAMAVAVAFAVGVVLGVVYEATENLAVPAVVHAAYSAALFGLSWWVVV